MSTRGITGKAASTENSPSLGWPGFSLFDSSLTTHPALLFSEYGLHPRSASYLGVPFIPAFCLVQRIKGTPLPGSVAPANFIMYVLPTTGHLCPKKKMVWSAWGIRVAEECERKWSQLIIIVRSYYIVISISYAFKFLYEKLLNHERY